MVKPCNYRESDEEICTITYRAPELLDPKCYTYTSSVDMWAVGCIILDLLFCPSTTPIHDCTTGDAVLAVYTTMFQHNRELNRQSFLWETTNLTTRRGIRIRRCRQVSLLLLVSTSQPSRHSELITIPGMTLKPSATKLTSFRMSSINAAILLTRPHTKITRRSSCFYFVIPCFTTQIGG